MLTALAIGLVLAGCNKKAPPPASPPAKEKNWTAEAIAADPEGYLVYQDSQIDRNITDRKTRLDRLTVRRQEIGRKRDAMAENLHDIQNVQNRMEQAIRKSEDEDRVPVQMGGRTFTREEAQEVVQRCKQYLDDRASLSEQYDLAITRLKQVESKTRNQVDALGRLKEQLGLDLDKVRLNKNLAELGDLHKTEVELAALGKQLGDMDEDILSAAAMAQKELPKVDAEKMLNK